MNQWRGLEPSLVPYAEATVELARRYGIDPVVTSVRRNWQEQQKLRDNYLKGLSTFPANAPGDSGHQWGVAWDSTVPPHQLELWNRIRSHFGWKLYANDPVHAEYPNWRAYTAYLTVS